MNNDSILLDFWANHQWPQVQPLYFRLYYDDMGRPLRYSRHEEPGLYIEVTPEEFAIGNMQVRVINGGLEYPPPPRPPKLVPAAQGVACHPDDVTVIVSPSADHKQYWNMKTYDAN
jgi:hypothetical protein